MNKFNCIANEMSIVMDIADKMKDPGFVKSVTLESVNDNRSTPSFTCWDDLSLGQGYPSFVLFYNELHQQFPEKGWDMVTHDYIIRIKAAIERTKISDFSLYSGLAGICFAVFLASQQRTRYQNLLNQLDLLLIKSIEKFHLRALKEDIERGVPSAVADYDLIQGIVGIGVYYLHNLDQNAIHASFNDLIQILIKRTEPIQVKGIEVPGWYIPYEGQFIEEDKQHYPEGNFNIGVAHGVPGILALLSLAMIKGIVLPGQREAILRIADWIRAKAVNIKGRLYWPERVAWNDEIHQINQIRFLQRMGWCYGKPGILRSLYLASLALHDTGLGEYVHLNYRHIFELNEDDWYLPSPMFCHGLAGLYTITKHMARDFQDAQLWGQATKLKEKICHFYHPEHPLGFRDVEPVRAKREERIPHECCRHKSGFLEGAAGTALTLLDGLSPAKSHWEGPFLISTF